MRELAGQGLRIRDDLESFTATELAALSAGFSAMYAIDDSRGYARIAGLCADPGFRAVRGGPLFLPWNRAHLNLFELSLRNFAPALALPWWDWTSGRSRRAGIPSAFAPESPNEGGAGPLTSARIMTAQEEGPERTSREPGDPARLPAAAAVEELFAVDDYRDFASRLEDIHDQVHDWVGGTFSVVRFASWDPLYWIVQAMVDRIWWRWQEAHPSATLDSALKLMALAPLNVTVADVLDAGGLGYTYREGQRPAASEVEVRTRAISDQPEKADSLGFNRLVDGLFTLLNDRNTTLPLAIGVTGQWGAGKSSLMVQLRQRMDVAEPVGEERRWYTVLLEAWKYEGSERLWAALTKAVYEQTQQRMGRLQRVWFRLRLEWRRHLFKGADKPRFDLGGLVKLLLTGVGPSVVPFAAAFIAYQRQQSSALVSSLTAGGFGTLVISASHYWGLLADPFKRTIQGYVDRSARDQGNQLGYTADADHDVHCLADVLLTKNRALAVFVDDLDRCSPAHVVELVETVNQVFNSFPGRPCVFILGMDREIVTSSIEANFDPIITALQRSDPARAQRFGTDFLDKILQMTIQVPAPGLEGMQRLLQGITGNAPPGHTASPSEAHVAQYQEEIRERHPGTVSDVQAIGTRIGQGGEIGPADGLALQEAIKRENTRRLAQAATDTGGVAEAEYYMLGRLRRNPRLLKRFDNAFRLQLWVAIRSAQRPLDVDSMIALARWVALSMAWPDLAETLLADTTLLDSLDRHVNDAAAPDTRYAQWLPDANLVELLQEASPAKRIMAISPTALLGLT